MVRCHLNCLNFKLLNTFIFSVNLRKKKRLFGTCNWRALEKEASDWLRKGIVGPLLLVLEASDWLRKGIIGPLLLVFEISFLRDYKVLLWSKNRCLFFRQTHWFKNTIRMYAAELRTVSTIVIAHTFCAYRDTRVSYRWCLLIQEYFCAVQNYAEKVDLKKLSWYPKKIGGNLDCLEII